MAIVNLSLVKQPMNWLTVILMLLIAGIVFHLFMRFWDNN